MTKRPTGSTSKLRRGTQDLLERRGMMAGLGAKPRPIGPVLHTTLSGGTKSAGYGTYAALAGESPFAHRGAPEERAHTGAPQQHAELKGHRHRGAEKHSAH
jgi:hypothetical protein